MIAVVTSGPSVFGQRVSYRDYEQACAGCHDQPGKAPPQSVLVQMPPETIYRALTTGPMQIQAAALSDAAKRGMAEFLSGRKLDTEKSASMSVMSNPCLANPPIGDIAASGTWNGWGVDVMNTRFQPPKTAGLTADQVPQLKLKWAFGLPSTARAWGLPTVIANRVFTGTDTGYIYSIDASSGCVYWSYRADAAVRTAVSVGVGIGGKALAYFGDQRGNAYAIEAGTGTLVWKVNVESHPLTRITGAPTLFEGRLYVGVSSDEESAGTLPKYECCTFRGSVTALDAATGNKIWKSYTVMEPHGPVRKNSNGVQLYGPAGAGVWSAPTIDPKRRMLYVATGNAYTEPASKGSDAVVAMNLDTGKIIWSAQEQAGDAWITNCAAPMGHDDLAPKGPLPENCPSNPGDDDDFGQSPIIRELEDGRTILVVAQRRGRVFAHNPDNGDRIWHADLGSLTLWGGATDGKNVYYGTRKGVSALRLTNGERIWATRLEPAQPEHPGFDGAVSLIPGVVFLGGEDGKVRALSTETGRQIWEYNTVQDFKTVNGVAAKGGSIAIGGPTITGGMLFVGSGYIGINRGMPGNVILAFSAE